MACVERTAAKEVLQYKRNVVQGNEVEGQAPDDERRRAVTASGNEWNACEAAACGDG